MNRIPEKPTDAMWSDEQWEAIYASGKDILVNAGAGSGKTAVLTERIVEILKKGVKLNSLIVLTFTKAAAAEMKERVRKKLERESFMNSSLKEALENLDSAAIQTFDSFALQLVRKYHYLLGVDRSLSIGDGVIFSIEKKKIIDEVFEELYEEENPGFYHLISLFAIKNDNSVKRYIYQIDEALKLLADPDRFFNTYIEEYYDDSVIDERIEEFKALLDIERTRISMRLENLKASVYEEILIEHIYQIEEALTELFLCKEYSDYWNIKGLSLPRIPRFTGDPDQKSLVEFEKKEIKKILERIDGYLVYESRAQMREEILATKPYAETILEILRRMNRRISEFKKRINCYEFHDIARFAIQLVKDNAAVRESLRLNTYEILIDEYQDTSDIQEVLIGYIANNNVYMVGDMKQSIYRFRNANPEIFRNKYREFKENHIGMAIDLSRNFRSRSHVLHKINLVFSQVMSFELGGVDYNEMHRLVYGNKNYPDESSNPDMEVLTYNYEEHPLSQHEIEAFMVADDIKKRMENGFCIYDASSKTMRFARYSDFTILTAEKKQFDLYKKIFEYKKIPLCIHKEESFVRSNEIYAIKNLLRLVYCYYDSEYGQANFRDAALSVLRSFLFEIDDFLIDEILQENGQAALKRLFPAISSTLITISSHIEKSTASEILGEIYREFAVYEKIIRIGNVEQAEDKLNYLLQKFKELDQIGYTFLDAIAYLSEIMEASLDLEYAKPSLPQTGAVNMMTIHKSKGLEFPVCYFPELGTKFNFSDIKERVLFEKKYGIILPVFQEGLKDTFYKALVKQAYKMEEISERLRVFYVALTRTKEKMIFVCPNFGTCLKKNNDLVPLVDRLNYNSMYSILESIQYSLSGFTEERLVNQYTKDYETKIPLSKLSQQPAKKRLVHQVSVKRSESKTQIASLKVAKLLTKEETESINLGTAIHHYLETIDFMGDPAPQIAGLLCSDTVKKKLNKFFNSELLRNTAFIRTLHEYEFEMEKAGTSISGVIDLILETETELIIIDYKLSELAKEEYQKQLSIYKDYLSTVSKKRISAYLYSIMKEEFLKV